MTCCGIVVRRWCAYCRATIRLIRERRCVSCRAVVTQDTLRMEGLCATCRERHVQVSKATARLLKMAAQARYRERAA